MTNKTPPSTCCHCPRNDNDNDKKSDDDQEETQQPLVSSSLSMTTTTMPLHSSDDDGDEIPVGSKPSTKRSAVKDHPDVGDEETSKSSPRVASEDHDPPDNDDDDDGCEKQSLLLLLKQQPQQGRQWILPLAWLAVGCGFYLLILTMICHPTITTAIHPDTTIIHPLWTSLFRETPGRRSHPAPFNNNKTKHLSGDGMDTMSASLPQQHEQKGRRRLAATDSQGKTRLLYIITTLAEYNSGTRATVKGSDRLQETLIPVMVEGVTSMLAEGYHVDVFLVCHFTLRPERYQLVRAALPSSVGLDYWNEATPLGYDTSKPKFHKLENRTLHLSRQHRFVIKDKLKHYDMFVCFEDDMIIHASHVTHYRAVTAELKRLEQAAPEDLDVKTDGDTYHGPMTKGMLKRMIPGFIRVEVLLNEDQYPAQSNVGPVPVDLNFGTTEQQQVSPEYCCHVSASAAQARRIPESPDPSKLMLWETNILPLGVRKMPQESSFLDWVVTLRGPNQNNLPRNQVIGDYWSNRNHRYTGQGGEQNKKRAWTNRRPGAMEFKYINNQGGWMATREQLWEWHTEICPGGFLPPYEAPHYRFDGLDMRNVEWYSGGMQLATVRHACNMQRIVMIDSPQNFSKSLLYHSANNKQQQLAGKREESFVKANTLLGQLNTVRKQAESEIPKA